MEKTTWKKEVWTSHGFFGNQTVALSWFAVATVGLRSDWNKRWLKFLVHTLGFFKNNICFKKNGAIPGCGAGKQSVLEGLEFLTGTQMWAWRAGIDWIFCSALDCHSLETGTEAAPGVWVAPWNCWSCTHRKIRLFGLPSLAPRAALNTQNKGIKCRKTL